MAIGLFSFSGIVQAQQLPRGLSDTMFSTYYQQRVSLFRLLPDRPGQIIFLGNSITDGGEWGELFPDRPDILNRGISGDLTAGVLNRLDEITNRKPAKIFLLIGTNDLARGISPDSVLHNILLIAKRIHRYSPATRLYVQSIFPVNPCYHQFQGHTSNIEKIKSLNQSLAANAAKLDYIYVDVFDILKGQDGFMDRGLTNDGLHLKGPGYMRWKHLIYPYVMDLTPQPALLPAPKMIEWQKGKFPLYQLRQISYRQDSLKATALQFIQQNRRLLPALAVGTATDYDGPVLVIECVKHLDQWPANAGSIPADQRGQQAYTLRVTDKQISLRATSRQGIYNGLQTLKQLMRDGSFIDNCRISDFPSFAWRGYMIDAGRNYQPLDLIKKQIEIMADLKMNIFHFHLTEDVAWRLAIKKYPQLTAAASMTRDKGLFYTQDDIRELMQYCRDRFITFIPEIDMPGHSAAFTRAMGFDMQSDSGIAVIKNILNEICDTYDLPFIHIGADEVHIHNKDFLPTIMNLLTARGRKIIGWQPGGTYTPAVYRQLWGDDKERRGKTGGYKRIDSRNLYINHMAPEESVISIYNHMIDQGDTNNIGGTLCLWNDRKLASPLDNLKQNPTIAAMLAFAEKCWNGGGVADNLTGLNRLSASQQKSFAAFENRLLSIQKTFYKDLPFQYIRQSNIEWQLSGPFDNKGDLARAFAPEQYPDADRAGAANSMGTVTGATIILRHVWEPAVKGLLPSPRENTTYYARGRYWSPVDTTALLWAGFYDYSRSTATAPPAMGTWGNLSSKIWLNGRAIAPPRWQRAGQGGDLEIPYIDENYYFRPLVRVHLQKGWNRLLLKVPVGGFHSGLWYAPVKWMFSAMFVQMQPASSCGNMEQNEFIYRARP